VLLIQQCSCCAELREKHTDPSHCIRIICKFTGFKIVSIEFPSNNGACMSKIVAYLASVMAFGDS
jgi:hypothetical protein